MGAIATTWLQILWCRSYARHRHRALHKNLNPESNTHKQDPRQLLRSRGSAGCNSHKSNRIAIVECIYW
ncbi:hypothetical protein GXM_02846 [Nostoc sphaeroides CCNUC1]|uniref:Uncharacterized protein n=1 Tax=Nostoc sphaeroides CCNUC1 TaxID=2653204 RepID=A0A5P8VZZ5_9NOSO|nr:hypothetical protein GXM_02846 [Nostoc sphaeroides CCNUC1]